MPTWKKVLIALALLTIGIATFAVSRVLCIPAYFKYGVVLDYCPVGEVHPGLEVNANNLRRGQFGRVDVSAFAHWTGGATDNARTFYFKDVLPQMSLVRVDKENKVDKDIGLSGEGRARKGSEEKGIALKTKEDKGWLRSGRSRYALAQLPADLKDGDYELRVKSTTRAGEASIAVPLAIYAPARVHVLTDRPLYEPGNSVQFRALVLRARDLAPLDERPGKFIVRDPSGQVVLEESAPAGAFGIVEGGFPLDARAPTGRWTITWASGDARGAANITVEPFTLPRFTVDVESVKPAYGPGETPRVRLNARYASGVPVRGARVDLEWRFSGAWPPPPSFRADLKSSAETDKNGRVLLTLPAVPRDLRGKVDLAVNARVSDPAGDVQSGAGSVRFSEDKIDAEVVTELEGGLVEGFNNRVYLRATTPTGAPLREVKLIISRAWDKSDEGQVVETDADGVAALQLDPGPAVNVVIPPMPVRPPPPPVAVARTGALDLTTDTEPRLKDLAALDRWNSKLEPCIRFVDGRRNVKLTVQLSAQGDVERTFATGPAAECLARAMKPLRLPAGRARVLELSYELKSDLATIRTARFGDVELNGLEVAERDARGCLGRLGSAREMSEYAIAIARGGALKLEWKKDANASGVLLNAKDTSCVKARFDRWAKRLELDEEQDAISVFRFEILPAPSVRAVQPKATTKLGYELKVIATSGGEEIGDTKIFVAPGTVPPLRVRPEQVVVKAGSEVHFDILRGPSFDGTLPKKLFLKHEKRTLEVEREKEQRRVSFKLPDELDGWWTLKVNGAMARIFVLPKATLEVALSSDKAVYRPGESAKLAVKTTANGKGQKAAVSLVGVDETLGTLAPLPGSGELDGLRPTPSMRRRAFGALEAAALVRGRIAGENARAATVLMVSRLPSLAELDRSVSGSARHQLDPVPVLVDNFYTVLEYAYKEVRTWEAAGKKDEKMDAARMAECWSRALKAAEKDGKAVTDIFGRDLKLKLLPSDLLELVDPRVVVADSTRLPEDVENWVRWVRRNS